MDASGRVAEAAPARRVEGVLKLFLYGHGVASIEGLSMGADGWAVRGDMAAGAFTVYHFKGEQLIAADSVNASKDHLLVRKLLDADVSPTREQAGDVAFDLASLLVK